MNRLLAVSILLPLASIAPAVAQSKTQTIADSGNRYLEVCASTEKPTERWNEMDFLNAGVCTGFMMGFLDGVNTATGAIQHFYPSLNLKGSFEDLSICVPENVEVGQLIRVVLKYVREHPEQAHLPSAALVTMAELAAFPCIVPAQKQ